MLMGGRKTVVRCMHQVAVKPAGMTNLVIERMDTSVNIKCHDVSKFIVSN